MSKKKNWNHVSEWFNNLLEKFGVCDECAFECRQRRGLFFRRKKNFFFFEAEFKELGDQKTLFSVWKDYESGDQPTCV